MRNLTVKLLFTSLIFFHLRGSAQNIALGIKGGAGTSSLAVRNGDANRLNTAYDPKWGPSAGIFAEYQFTNLISLQATLEYSAQGGTRNGLQALATPADVVGQYPAGQAPSFVYANYRNNIKLNYLALPVLVKFGLDIKHSKFRLYTSEGLFIGFLLNATQTATGTSDLYPDATGKNALPGGAKSLNITQNIKGQFHSINAGIDGSIGVNYATRHGNIFFEGSGNYGFLTLQKNTQAEKNTVSVITISIGYSYWIGVRKIKKTGEY